MKKLLIYGSSDLAKLASYYFSVEDGFSIAGYVVDKEFKDREMFLGLPVVTWERAEKEFSKSETNLFVAIGYKSMDGRARAFESAIHRGYSLVNLVSKSAFVAKNVRMGINNFIMPGTVLEPGVEIGDNNIIWSNATVCHDSRLGNHNFIAANVTIGGANQIGSRCFLGFSSVVREGHKVGNGVVLGANSLLLKDAPNEVKLYGSPARIISEEPDSVVADGLNLRGHSCP